jgi:lysophospholipid acyltransferase (LPLAT)-like uncharacterized protein
MIAGESSKPKARPRRGGIVVPHKPNRLQRFAAWLIFISLRGLSSTLRYSWNDSFGLLRTPPEKPVIFCIWHNRLALCPHVYRLYSRKRHSQGIAALVSASKDGGFLSGILERFGILPVRGSSSRRGPQALLELTTWAERGYDLAITPDGPRGPAYVVQEGVMSLAQVTGMPIVPFSYIARWKISFKSWDRFQIPLPFSRCELNVGQPVHVPRDATDQERDALRRQLEEQLQKLSGS